MFISQGLEKHWILKDLKVLMDMKLYFYLYIVVLVSLHYKHPTQHVSPE